LATLLIKNGQILVGGVFSKTDILVNGEEIVKIEENIKSECKVLDAKGLFIIPGGIDPHVHMHLPSPAGFSSDDFYSGSKSALVGGTTTLIDFVTPKRGQTITNALKQRKQEAQNCLTDYKFHVSPVEWTIKTESDILQCIESEGVRSFKAYMAYKNTIGLDNEDILKVMHVVGKAGGLVTVHAEMGDAIEVCRNNFAIEGKFSPEFHPKSRPAELEAIAVKKAIEMAAKANCPLYIVHVSTKKSVDYIRKAQLSGQKVFGETCMHYLLLDDSRYLGNFEQTAPFVLSPPLRKKEDQDALWQALADGTIQTVGTDHCPFTLEQKKFGVNDFRKIPNGAGSVEHRMSLLYTYGVFEKRISLERFIEVTSTNAAGIFGLSAKKGKIEVGADADLIIWNPEIESRITAGTHHMNCDIDIFDGFVTKGAPEYVIKSGEIAYSIEKGFMEGLLPGKFIN
jgi:dihydropyrimidinase